MADLDEIVEFLDGYLRIREIQDHPGAFNGLQVACRSGIDRVAAATDACQATIEQAADAGAQLLLVHHGLFWGDPLPVTGPTYRRLRALFDADLAVYAAHLPLDAHPEVGNSVLLAEALDLPVEGWLGEHEGVEGLGVWCAVDLPREELLARVEATCGRAPFLVPGGPPHVRRVGVITGGASAYIPEADRHGLDTFLTGEGKHPSYHQATELGLNVIYAGHYATETLGVRALAARVAEEFDVAWTFLDHPTGL